MAIECKDCPHRPVCDLKRAARCEHLYFFLRPHTVGKDFSNRGRRWSMRRAGRRVPKVVTTDMDGLVVEDIELPSHIYWDGGGDPEDREV